jgi:hypothetical protein
MNTTENNKLIAEFMGLNIINNIVTNGPQRLVFYTRYGDDRDNPDEYDYSSVYELKNLEYYTSWDWLMPVVEKIEYAHNCFVTITLVHAEITNRDLGQRDTPLNDPIFDIEADGKTKHEAIYKAVLKFIKWYNENK